MSISESTREFVRQRAQFACEYCGIREVDVGGQLTIDHFRPRASEGDDSLENLVYCCTRCNQYKGSYWPETLPDLVLWNPRLEPASLHFLHTEDCLLQPLTATGQFTLRLLQLNRPALVAHRVKRQEETLMRERLGRFHTMVQVYEQLIEQQTRVIMEQRSLLEEQHNLLRRLLEQSQ